MKKLTISIAPLIVASSMQLCQGFVVDKHHPQTSSRRRYITSSHLKNVGNWISGVTNTPPSQPLLTQTLESELLVGTSLEDKELICVYKGSRDDWSATQFHQCVDEKGSALVVALTRSGQLFGGFNPLGWRSSDDYYNSNAAFLWYARGAKSVVRCPILAGGNAAIYDYGTSGPVFGSDLVIGDKQAQVMGGFAGPDAMDTSASAGNLKKGRCSIGSTYQADSPFPVRGDFQLVELEVYSNAALADGSTGSSPKWWPF
jgi:hypothetical protein